MFREMRRKKQLLSREESEEILKKGSFGVLALSGDDGYPYAVPLNNVYDGRVIYFHSAKSGHKLDAVAGEPKASFCVIDQDLVVPEEYTTYFRSVIVFGTVRILVEEKEKRKAIEKLAIKYTPEDGEENRAHAIEKDWKALCMLELTPQHMSGKEAIELTRQKKKNK